MPEATVYLVPAPLDENGLNAMPASLADAIKDCQVIFAENERSTRRFLKAFWKNFLPGEQIVIDDYEWYTIHKAEEQVLTAFREKLKERKNVAVISEAGCPGIADPGQLLVAVAQELNVRIKPLVGPSSILLALMASGMNGQQFSFLGYLPIDQPARMQAVREAESDSAKRNCTQIFIETPYRNNQLLETLLKTCRPGTRLCVAADLTGPNEWIKTRKVEDWKKDIPSLHKRPVIFLLMAGQ